VDWFLAGAFAPKTEPGIGCENISFPDDAKGKFKRGYAPLLYFPPSPLGKGIQGMGPPPPNRE